MLFFQCTCAASGHGEGASLGPSPALADPFLGAPRRRPRLSGATRGRFAGQLAAKTPGWPAAAGGLCGNPPGWAAWTPGWAAWTPGWAARTPGWAAGPSIGRCQKAVGEGQMGSALQISCFLTEGLFGYAREPTLIFSKVPGRTFFPNLSKFITFAAAPH